VEPQDSAEVEIYDQFAIGWNEIFDTTPQAPARESSPSSSRLDSRTPPGSKQRYSRPAASFLPFEATPSKAAGIGVGSVAAHDEGWSSKALFAAKRPPPYLRLAKGKQSSIDRGIRERNLNVPISQLRRPAAVIEPELDQMRAELMEEQRRKRQERRQNRRLARRCRVKDGEDLDELEERYLDSEFLQPFAEIVEPMHGVTNPNVKPLSKEYFASVNHRFGAPRSTWELLPPPPFSYR
jgi:hypothetical protein